MTADHERSTGIRLHPPQIVEAASTGDAVAEQTLRRYERRFARALASIINVLDPDVIVLGGGLSNLTSLYTNVPRLWGEFIFAAQRRIHEPNEPVEPTEPKTRLLPALHGATSGVRGAAWLWAAESPKR
jgi:predicted NBD/HSP70 family sugar kinase